jgi:hypothetical protein
VRSSTSQQQNVMGKMETQGRQEGVDCEMGLDGGDADRQLAMRQGGNRR